MRPSDRSWATWAAIGTVRVYQRLLGPLLPPVCRFHPSCSHYAIEALQTHGFWAGSALAGWRIARCNPFSRAGFDPVPRSRTRAPNPS